jgi:hypothetical protein
MITSDRRNLQLVDYVDIETSSSHQQCCQVINEKISDRIDESDDESWVCDYMCSKK